MQYVKVRGRRAGICAGGLGLPFYLGNSLLQSLKAPTTRNKFRCTQKNSAGTHNITSTTHTKKPAAPQNPTLFAGTHTK